MVIYEKADKDIHDLVSAMMVKFHGPLSDAGVTVDVLWASSCEGRPVKAHGYPALAVIKINSYRLRVQGHADAEITLDKKEWEVLSMQQREALIDHELEHLDLKLDKDGGVVRDDLERPQMSLRKHDHQFGWFDAVAERHGVNSQEVIQCEKFLIDTMWPNASWAAPG